MTLEEAAQTKSRTERRPMGRRKADGRKAFAVCLGGAALVCAFGLAVTWARLAVVERGYNLGRERARNEQLLRERAKLNLEIESLQTARRVEMAARELGLVKAERVLVVPPATVAATSVNTAGVLASN